MESNIESIVSKFGQLSNDEKRECFEQLLATCPSWLQMDLEKIFQNSRKRDFVAMLPVELVNMIFDHMPIQELATTQLVCKTWRDAVVSWRPLHEIACERLDVAESEYETPEQAVAICETILRRNREEADDWIEYVACSPTKQVLESSTIIRTIDVGIEDGQYYICTVSIYDSTHSMVTVSRANATRAGDYDGIVCQFVPNQLVSSIKFCGHNAIFCGTYFGSIERWTTKPERLKTYGQHGGGVLTIDANFQRDLLFTGSADRTVQCKRISTGAIRAVSELFEYWVVEVKLKPCVTPTDPLVLAVLSKKQALGPFLPECDLRTLNIFEYSDDDNDRRFIPLYNIACNPKLSGVYASITPIVDGFRFVRLDMERIDAPVAVCEFDSRTSSVRTSPLHLTETQFVRGAIGLGTKYCLVLIKDAPSSEPSLFVYEKRDDSWEQFKTFSSIRIVRGSCHPRDHYVFALGDSAWLNGFRPSNPSIAYVTYAEDSVTLAFWKR